MSMRPKARIASPTARSTSAALATSQASGVAALPIFRAASRAPASLRSSTATRAPSRAKVSAMPSPKPCAAPVTRAVLLARRIALLRRLGPGGDLGDFGLEAILRGFDVELHLPPRPKLDRGAPVAGKAKRHLCRDRRPLSDDGFDRR